MKHLRQSSYVQKRRVRHSGFWILCALLWWVLTGSAGCQTAEERLQVSCDGGALADCYELGRRLMRGAGMRPDPSRGVALFDRACDGRLGPACTRLGQERRLLAQTASDLSVAADAWKRGCAASQPASCALLAALFRDGLGRPKSRPRAAVLFDRACDEGHMLACVALGRLIASAAQTREGVLPHPPSTEEAPPGDMGSPPGDGTEEGRRLLADPAGARRRFEVACNTNHSGCAPLGQLYLRGKTVAQDSARAIALFQDACDDGFAEGCVALGWLHIRGRYLPQSDKAAIPLFRRGCENGGRRACLALAEAYQVGRGVSLKPTTARIIADKALKPMLEACEGHRWWGCDGLQSLAEVRPGSGDQDLRHTLLLEVVCGGAFPVACRSLQAGHPKY